MAKMFVHYSGTVEAFKSIASQYDNKIVFIKGGENGEGAAIYTHGKYYGDVKEALTALQQTVGGLKYFTSIKAGDKTASATGKDGVITFNAADPAQVSVDVDANGVNIGLATKFTDEVAANTSGLAAEITRATEAEGKIRADLGTKDDTADKATAFGRIAQLVAEIEAMTGGNGSIADQINAALTLLSEDAKEGDYVASISQENGKIVATMGNFNFDEAGAAAAAETAAKAYADTQANAAKEAAIADAADKYQEKGNYEAAGAAAVVQGNLDTEIARAEAKEGELAEAIAAEKARMDAFMLSADVTEKAVDTLKEIQEYITSDGAAAEEMVANISAAQAAADNAQSEVDALESVVAGVKATADAAATQDALNAEIDRADKAEKANAAAIKAIVDDYLVGQDRTDLEGMISGKVDQSAYNTKMAELAKADSDILIAVKKHADDAIADLNKSDVAVANQFVTAVSETAGVITVSRSAISASQIGITNTEADAFAASTQNVQAALNELADFWAWEEL